VRRSSSWACIVASGSTLL